MAGGRNLFPALGFKYGGIRGGDKQSFAHQSSQALVELNITAYPACTYKRLFKRFLGCVRAAMIA